MLGIRWGRHDVDEESSEHVDPVLGGSHLEYRLETRERPNLLAVDNPEIRIRFRDPLCDYGADESLLQGTARQRRTKRPLCRRIS
jgi:hypothetical protein